MGFWQRVDAVGLRPARTAPRRQAGELVHGVLTRQRVPWLAEGPALTVHGVLSLRCRHGSRPTHDRDDGPLPELVHGPLTPSVKRETALGWFLPLLEMLARFMEGAQAMSRAVRWDDAAYIEDVAERRRKIRRSPIELKQA